VKRQSLLRALRYAVIIYLHPTASGRADLVPALSDQIQNGVESLKWDTSVDWTVLEDIQAEFEFPEFLDVGQKKTTFLEEAARRRYEYVHLPSGGPRQPRLSAQCPTESAHAR
jgi:hypothetical protein